MSPYIGRRFDEVRAELNKVNEKYSWEIARASSRAFEIDETDLYVLRDVINSAGERKLVLAYLCRAKAKGGHINGI